MLSTYCTNESAALDFFNDADASPGATPATAFAKDIITIGVAGRSQINLA